MEFLLIPQSLTYIWTLRRYSADAFRRSAAPEVPAAGGAAGRAGLPAAALCDAAETAKHAVEVRGFLRRVGGV